MPDGALNTMTTMSTKDTKTETTTEKEIEVDAEATEEIEADTEEVEAEESTDDVEAKDTDNEIDYDAEIEKERKGKPDPLKAKDAFKERNEKRKEPEDDEDDKPLTKKDLQAILASERVERRSEEALAVARGMAGSDKEAQLIVEKWKNRTFPPTLSLTEQIEESYAITHRKKLIGERNEALRALAGKETVNKNPATAHQEGQKGTEPKMAPNDLRAIQAAGFAFNSTTRRYEKKLSNGSTLIRDPKTKKVSLAPRAR